MLASVTALAAKLTNECYDRLTAISGVVEALDKSQSVNSLLWGIDEGLYWAESEGRNRVVSRPPKGVKTHGEAKLRCSSQRGRIGTTPGCF